MLVMEVISCRNNGDWGARTSMHDGPHFLIPARACTRLNDAPRAPWCIAEIRLWRHRARRGRRGSPMQYPSIIPGGGFDERVFLRLAFWRFGKAQVAGPSLHTQRRFFLTR